MNLCKTNLNRVQKNTDLTIHMYTRFGLAKIYEKIKIEPLLHIQ